MPSFADIGVCEENLLVVEQGQGLLAERGVSRRPGKRRGRGGERMRTGRLRIENTSTGRQPAIV